MCVKAAIVAATGCALFAFSAVAQSSGSGFFINSAWVMTNDHVVEDCTRIEVGGFGTAQDVLRDPGNDLAVIRLAQPFRGQALQFRIEAARLAENLHAIGYPLSDVLSASVRVTSGSVSALNAFEFDDGLIQISAPIQPGNSGGPVVDDNGHVAGVAVGILNRSQAQNVNFAISGAVAQDFLISRAIAYEVALGPTGHQESLSDVIERAATATVQIKCFGLQRPPSTGTEAQVNGGFVISRDRDVIGFDYRLLSNTTVPACQSACDNDRLCRAFTFNRRHSACFLKEDGVILVTNADAISGYDSALAAELTDTGFMISADVDSPGGDYKRIKQSTFVNCVAECGVDAQCKGFAYVHDTQDCWLKDRVGRVQRMPGVEFGLK